VTDDEEKTMRRILEICPGLTKLQPLPDQAVRDLAFKQYEAAGIEGTVLIGKNASVVWSTEKSSGAYVHAYVWVDFEKAGRS